MNKEKFLKELENRLGGLPKEDIRDRIEFYSEIIDDKIEEGKTEEEAVKEIGSVDEVVSEIAKDTPFIKLVKEKVIPKRNIKPIEIALIILGFPIWLPLIILGFTLCLVAYILIFVLVIVAYSLEISFIGGSIYFLIGYLSLGYETIYIGYSILSLSLAIFTLFACIASTKFTIKLSKKIVLSIKKKIVTRG